MVKNNYIIKIDNQEWAISPNDLELDLVENEDGHFHILQGQKSYHAELIYADFANKTVQLKINGNSYTIQIADQYDQLVKQLGLTASSSQKVNTVKAPMPGLVLDVLVKEGQKIAKGEALLILEAMKMENVIKAMGEGTVKKIHVNKGAAIDKGQLMIEMK